MTNNEIKKIEEDLKKANGGEGGDAPGHDDIRELMKENLRLTKEIHSMSKYMKRFVILNQIFGVIKILLIAIPLILGIMYLPPLLNQVMSQYQTLLGITQKTENLQNVPSLPSDVLDFLKK